MGRGVGVDCRLSPASYNIGGPALTNHGTVLRSDFTPGVATDDMIEAYLAEDLIDVVFLQHAEAGCHIARIDRLAAEVGQLEPRDEGVRGL